MNLRCVWRGPVISTAVLLRAALGLGVLYCWAFQAAAQVPALPQTGLVAYYPFAGSAADSSGKGNHGQVEGAAPAPDRFGRRDAALHFDGENDRILVANSPTLDVHGHSSLSICAWINTESAATRQGIVNKWGPALEEDDQFNLRLEADGMIHFMLSDEPTDISSTARLQAHRWYFVAGVYNATRKRIEIYIDGTLDQSAALDFAIWDTQQAVEIGKDGVSHWKGEIDDVRLYARALTPRDILALYQQGGWGGPAKSDSTASPPGGDSGPVSWWAAEGNINDQGRAGNQGKIVGRVGYVQGPVGQAFYFDGSSYIEAAADSMPTGDEARTLALWARVDEVVSQEALFAGYGEFGTGDGVFVLGMNITGPQSVPAFFFSQWGSGVGCSACPEIFELNLEQWYHVAVTSVGGRTTLYINGMPVGSDTLSVHTAEKTPFYMGSIPGELGTTRRLKGAIDEVLVYDRVLSAAEIQQLFAAGQAPPASTPPDSAATPPDTVVVSLPPDSVKVDTASSPPLDFSTFRILAIADVPNDRGRQVRIRWQRHPLDAAGTRPQVIRYGIWRRFDPDLPSLRPKLAATSFGTYPEGEWTFVGEAPARGVETYSFDAPTLADSTARSGIYYSAFFVSAQTTAGDSLYDCPPDSGYSVDNSLPAAPGIFTGALVNGQVRLVWSPVPIGVAYYAVYRGSTADFRPQVIHQLVFAPRFTETFDPRQPFYCVAAIGITGALGPFTRIAQIRPLAHSVPQPEDFDGDGQIGFADFFSLADAIGSADSRFDLDGDGVVDLRDYLLFAAGFGGN